ncbi:MAG: hypothetical protein QXL57_06675 [Candidatus Bathyarchaeia archaeon]
MHADVEILTEIPCFKCLFWEPIKQGSLYCNPNECQKLTEWLLKNVEKPQQNVVGLEVVPKTLISAKEK